MAGRLGFTSAAEERAEINPKAVGMCCGLMDFALDYNSGK